MIDFFIVIIMKYTRTDLDFVYKVIAHPTRPFFRATAVIRFHNFCNLCNPCNFYNFSNPTGTHA